MTIVTSALKATNSEIPENEGGMKIDFSVACHKGKTVTACQVLVPNQVGLFEVVTTNSLETGVMKNPTLSCFTFRRVVFN